MASSTDLRYLSQSAAGGYVAREGGSRCEDALGSYVVLHRSAQVRSPAKLISLRVRNDGDGARDAVEVVFLLVLVLVAHLSDERMAVVEILLMCRRRPKDPDQATEDESTLVRRWMHRRVRKIQELVERLHIQTCVEATSE